MMTARCAAIGLLTAFFLFVGETRGEVEAVVGVRLKVSDVERSVQFYTKVLPFEIVGRCGHSPVPTDVVDGSGYIPGEDVILKLGDEMLRISHYHMMSKTLQRPEPQSNDLYFQHIAIVVSDIEAAFEILERHQTRRISSRPQTIPRWNRQAAGISAYYFRDPDGHPLEIISFPPGKGDIRWQQKDRVFLGIDHTAIVVSKTERSLSFYQDTLGLRVLGKSENYGVEQEMLSGVSGARVRITTLRALSGPGIEFLEYLTPARSIKESKIEQTGDIRDTETLVRLSTRSTQEGHLPRYKREAKSDREKPDLLNDQHIALRDPDGHALRSLQSCE